MGYGHHNMVITNCCLTATLVAICILYLLKGVYWEVYNTETESGNNSTQNFVLNNLLPLPCTIMDCSMKLN